MRPELSKGVIKMTPSKLDDVVQRFSCLENTEVAYLPQSHKASVPAQASQGCFKKK